MKTTLCNTNYEKRNEKIFIDKLEFYEERDSFKAIFLNNVVHNQQSGQQIASIEKYKNM